MAWFRVCGTIWWGTRPAHSVDRTDAALLRSGFFSYLSDFLGRQVQYGMPKEDNSFNYPLAFRDSVVKEWHTMQQIDKTCTHEAFAASTNIKLRTFREWLYKQSRPPAGQVKSTSHGEMSSQRHMSKWLREIRICCFFVSRLLWRNWSKNTGMLYSINLIMRNGKLDFVFWIQQQQILQNITW